MEDEVEAPDPPGMPAWVMTFADLMSLLMCFFVLLLSFSQMDLSKFKKVAGSMENAFGVQRQIVAYEIPKGTSVIAREFSPGKPTPTPLQEIRQMTIEELRQTLDFDEIRTEGKRKQREEFDRVASEEKLGSNQSKDQAVEAEVQEMAKQVAELMSEQILDGSLEVEAEDQRIIIRILEQGSFASGEDVIRPSFVPVLEKITSLLEKMPGKITIAGHTDDVPIYTSRFRSNWELSASRAVSVAHQLVNNGKIHKNRITVSGYADTKPLFANDSDQHRQQNRRVEIVMSFGDNPQFNNLTEPVIEKKPTEEESEVPQMEVEELNSSDDAEFDSSGF